MRRDSIVWAMTDIADDLIREAKEDTMRDERRIPSRTARLVLVAAVIGMILAVSAGAFFVIRNWDSIFERRFQPTEEMKSQMEGLVDEPIAASTKNGVTLAVEQTITDGSEFYAVISMKLPEEFDMSQLIVSGEDEMELETLQMFSSYDEATGHWYTGPSTAVALWFQAEFPAEELDSLTIQDVENSGMQYQEMMVGGSFLPKRVDVANRTAYYLLMTNVEGQVDSYTVWFEKVTLGDVDGEAIIPGPFYVTWTPSYDLSSIVTQTMERDGAEIGTLTLSPLSITMDIPELFDTMDTPPEEEALEEFYRIASGILTEEELEALERDPVAFLENRKSINDYVCVSIQYRDGSSQELEVNCSSEWDENSGNVHVWARISLYDVLGTFLDLDEVQSVTVNDVVIQIPS